MARGGGTSLDVDVRVEGMAELGTSLTRLKAALGDIGAMRAIAEQTARLARSFAPVKTGLLQSTITAVTAKNKATVKAGSNKVPYAAVINYGWPKRNIVASRFLQKADDAMKPRVPALLDAAIKRLIKEGRLS